MATRQKKKVIQGVTREAADNAFATFAKADASINKINATLELTIAKIREKYQTELTALTQERDLAFETLQAFAIENQAELFSKKKSLDMAHGTIGFRTGNPKLKTLKGFTWSSALELVRRMMPTYIREKVEIDKEKLLADRDSDSVVVNTADQPAVSMLEAMKGCGLEVVQDETFYVEPKKEETD